MDITRFPMKQVLANRFTPWGMWTERTLLRVLSRLYFHGNEAAWDYNRRRAYHLWMAGRDLEQELKIPTFIIHNWITIWTAYNRAFGSYNEKLQNANGRGAQYS